MSSIFLKAFFFVFNIFLHGFIAFKLLCISHVLRTSHHDDKRRALSLSMGSLGRYVQIM
jgi:hypothetical protein